MTFFISCVFIIFTMTATFASMCKSFLESSAQILPRSQAFDSDALSRNLLQLKAIMAPESDDRRPYSPHYDPLHPSDYDMLPSTEEYDPASPPIPEGLHLKKLLHLLCPELRYHYDPSDPLYDPDEPIEDSPMIPYDIESPAFER